VANSEWCPHCGAKDNLVADGSRFDHRTGERKKKLRCTECERSTQNPLDYDPKINIFDTLSRPLPKTNRYVITCAQNATNYHKKFLTSLVKYCDHNDAELLIIPIRYKNPTSTWSKTAKKYDWWHEDLMPFMFVDRANIVPGLTILADIRTQLTAEKPLTGFETITGESWGILGHPKLQLTAIASPAHKLPKIMTTTGAVTLSDNYIDSKAGKKGQFHHTYGACIVEVDGDKTHIRQINAMKNGTFIDLEKKYTPDGVEDAPPAAALIMGDTHVQFVDPDVVDATFNGKHSIVETLKPRQLVFHDVLDFYSQNWHDKKNPFIQYGKHVAQMSNVADEVDMTCRFLNQMVPKGTKAIIVPSNHNEGLDRWIRDHDWKTDPSHMEFYLETALEMLRSTKMEDRGVTTVDPFRYWAEKKLLCDNIFLNRDDPYEIQGIECGFHGDEGPNGAKGSIEAFKRIASKTVIGHFHWPAISEGCYQVGTNSRLKLQYNTGPSSWMHADCVIYANGKRSLIMILDGDWRLHSKKK
jgi:hypothetical protein